MTWKSQKMKKYAIMFQWNTTNGKWKRVYSQLLSPMIQLYTKATVQSGGTARSVQRDLILLVNRSSSWRSSIFFYWSDRGIVRVFFCYSAVLRVVRAPSLPSSMAKPWLNSAKVDYTYLDKKLRPWKKVGHFYWAQLHVTRAGPHTHYCLYRF